jgi:signal transduction histidine kinase/CheY-like chemotaxis protein
MHSRSFFKKLVSWVKDEDRLNREEYVHIARWASIPGILGNIIFYFYLPAVFNSKEILWARTLNVLAFFILYTVSMIKTDKLVHYSFRWMWFLFCTWQFFIYPWMMLSHTDEYVWAVSIAVFGSTAAFVLRSFDLVIAILVGVAIGFRSQHDEMSKIACIVAIESPLISMIGITFIRHIHQRLVNARINLAKVLYDTQQQEQIKDEFIENAAHELRSPLSVAIALMSKNSDINSVRSLAVLHQLKDKISAMIQFRTVGTDLDLVILEHNLEDIISDVLKSSAIIASSSGLSFTAVLQHRAIVHADYQSIRTILSNLVNNAIKYTEVGSVSVVVGIDSKGHVVIKVQDTGVGIPVDKIDAIFDRYYRIPGNKSSGFGVGLSVVKDLVAKSNGSIKVKSHEIGTAFVVKIPCEAKITPASKPLTIASSKPEQSSTVEEMSDVVIVDDNAYLRTSLHEMLVEDGISTSSFSSSPEALAYVVMSRPKVVLIDLNMPKLNARQFVSLLASSNIEVTFIFMSGYSKETAAKFLEFTPKLFLAKPFNNSALISAVKSALSQ